MTLAVLVNEGKNDIHEIDLDISPEKNEIYKILRGKATFLGQWPDKSVVIVTCESSVFELSMNLNIFGVALGTLIACYITVSIFLLFTYNFMVKKFQIIPNFKKIIIPSKLNFC